MKYFNNKHILLTGAASGIGRDLAFKFDLYGAKLALIDLNAESLESLLKECRQKHLSYIADVTDSSHMQSICSEVLAKWDKIDIVIANAGLGGINPGDHFSVDIDKKIMTVNYFGTINTLVPFIEMMKQQGNGHLVGISSQAAFRGLPGAASYSASKAAQMTLLESLRLDLREYNIAVSSIHPGFIKTPMTNHKEFEMPFMVSVEKAGYLIAKAIQKKHKKFCFPWGMNILSFVNKMLPLAIYDRLLPWLNKTKTHKRKAKIFS